MALINRSQAPIATLLGLRFRTLTSLLGLLGILTLLTNVPLMAQNPGPSSTSNADAELNESLRRANREITALQKLVQAQNASYRRNVDSLNLQIADNIAKLGQNERALNIALEGFEAKYQEQNKAIQEFQDGLQSIKNRQLLTILAVLAAAILVLFVSVQWAFRKAFAKQTNYWNEFQASLLKK